MRLISWIIVGTALGVQAQSNAILRIQHFSTTHRSQETQEEASQVLHTLDDARVWFTLGCTMKHGKKEKPKYKRLGRSEKIEGINATDLETELEFDPAYAKRCEGPLTLKMFAKHSQFILFHFMRDQVMSNETLRIHSGDATLVNQLVVPLQDLILGGRLVPGAKPVSISGEFTFWISKYNGIYKDPERIDVPQRLSTKFDLSWVD